MAKLNNLKKVELLENTILEGNIERVKEVFAQQAPFEFTARALGLACRFVGAAMVKCLIELGLDFGYEFKSTLFSKYNCRHQLSNSTSVPVNYSRYVLSMQPSWSDAEKDRFSSFTLLSAESRAEVVSVLCENHEKIHFNPSELLYYAALKGDADIFRTLKAAGIEPSVYRRELLDGTLKYNRLDTEGRFHLEEISSALSAEQDDVFALRLNMLLEYLGGRKLMLSKDAYYDSWKEVFRSHWCTSAAFMTALQHTNLTERVKEWELIEGLIAYDNAEGLSHVLGQGWLKKSEDFKKLFELAEKKKASPSVMACILQYLTPDARENVKEEDDDLSLNFKPLSAAELKKMWGSKKREDGTLELTSYKGTETDIVVPAMIGKTPVTALSEDVFFPDAPRLTQQQIDARKNIRSVEIPASIKKLPDSLFSCGFYSTRPTLESVFLPEGLEEIGKKSFFGCTGLTQLTLPQSLKAIGANALSCCTALEEISLPEGVTQIGAGAFSGCTNLKEVSLPSALTQLPSSLFENCPSLKEITLPEGIRELPNSVFSRCGLEEYVVPKNITKIGSAAFLYGSLKKITLSEGISSIGSNAFGRCPIEEIVLPDSVHEIGAFAFKDCALLERVTLPEGVVIGEQAFAGCVKLKDEHGLIVTSGILQSFEGDITKALRLSSKVEKVSDSVLLTLPRIVYRPADKIVSNVPDLSDLNVGDEVSFGRFPQDTTFEMKPLVWQVIAQEGNRRLLMTKQAIIGISPECRLGQKDTWADSNVRTWLNSVFLETIFTEEERTHIPEVLLTNPNNRKTSPVTKGGADTLDRVFLLSYDELMNYLPEDAQQRAEVTPYAKNQWTSKRSTYFYRLRTPGTWGPVCVSCYIGGCHMTGNHVGVATLRPAVWVE